MFKNESYLKIISINIFIITIILIIYLLHLGSELILPFVIALFISFGIISISGSFKNRGMNNFFAYIFSAFSFFVFFFVIGQIINSNIEEMTEISKINFYQDKLIDLSSPILDYLTKFNISKDYLTDKILKSVDFKELFGSITNILFFVISNAGLILIYILFILLEYRFFREKIDLMVSNPLKKSKLNSIIVKIKDDIRGYFLIKTITSFSTGFLSYIVLIYFQIDFALFWSFIIFILNFIPTVGSIMAVGIVSIFAILQLEFSINLGIIISILVGIQIFIGNMIEPKLMGSRLNLSPLVILLSLGLWGVVWGVVGMLLSVPIMVIINIVLSKFDSTRSISILLSEKGMIDDSEEINIEKTKVKLLKLIKEKFKK